MPTVSGCHIVGYDAGVDKMTFICQEVSGKLSKWGKKEYIDYVGSGVV
jgi:hypothetical protein